MVYVKKWCSWEDRGENWGGGDRSMKNTNTMHPATKTQDTDQQHKIYLLTKKETNKKTHSHTKCTVVNMNR